MVGQGNPSFGYLQPCRERCKPHKRMGELRSALTCDGCWEWSGAMNQPGAWTSAFRKLFQCVEKCRVGNGSRFGTANYSFALRAQGRHRERHGDAVITKGIDFGAMERLSTGDSQAVLALI